MSRRLLTCALLLSLLWLSYPLTAWGAIAEVGAGSQRAVKEAGNVDSTTLAYPANVVSGNLLIVAGSSWWSTGGPASVTVTSTCSSALTVLLSAPSGNFKTFIAYGPATSSAACTVTVDPAVSANYLSFSIDEFSGVHATPLHVDGGISAANSTTPADGITTTIADTLLIGVTAHILTTTITPGGSYTQIGEIESITNQPHNAVFRLVTTAQAYTVDWTYSVGQEWLAQTAAFAPADAGGPVLPGGTRPMGMF